MLKRWILIILLGLLTACQSTNPNLPKKTYKAWELAATYPRYFRSLIRNVVIDTQDGKQYSSKVSIVSDVGNGFWSSEPAALNGESMYIDLPQNLYMCWLSYYDQKLYWTEIDIPLEVRQMMLESETKLVNPNSGLMHTFYSNRVVLGLEPGGKVKVWLTGIDAKFITEVSSTVIEVNNTSHYCQPWLNQGRTYFPQLDQESQDWIKANGVPSFDWK